MHTKLCISAQNSMHSISRQSSNQLSDQSTLGFGEKLDLPREIVSKWRNRFFEERLNGHSARIDEDSAKEMGIKAYAMKPLVMRDLANTIRKVLDNK